MGAEFESSSDDALDAAMKRRMWVWLKGWMGRLAIGGMGVWVVTTGVIFFLLRVIGEGNPLLGFLLFLPTALWILPGVMLGCLAVVLRFRQGVVLGVLGVGVLWMGMGFQARGQRTPTAASEREGGRFVVLTNNRGQNGGHSLRPFKNWIEPDVMVFQESSARASHYLKDEGYAEFGHGLSVGEFTLVSRYPVMGGEILEGNGGGSGKAIPYAARFEVDWKGRRVAVYGVHLPSPRGPLLAMRGGSFLYGLPVPLEFWRRRRGEESVFWDRQIGLVEALLERVKGERLPYVVAGDFNAPHLGYVHGLLEAVMTDAHGAGGSGLGFTFPGETRNPLSLGQPWLRLDHVFTGSTWEVEACWTEGERRSQHRAVAAALRFRE